jgi:putative tricarboxylic transport membrane protein
VVTDLINGFFIAFKLSNFIGVGLGVLLGIILGAIPGLTGTMAIALLIPLTYYMDPVLSISLLVGCYKGSVYGGSMSAILLNTPGTPEAAATTFDGYPLTLQGKAKKALTTALTASVMGDSFSDLVLLFSAMPIALIALKIGPPEYAMLVIFSLTIVASLAGSSLARGLVAAFFGLLLSTIGLDPITTSRRYSFGSIELDRGIQLLPLLIGLLALSEIFMQIEQGISGRKRDADGAGEGAAIADQGGPLTGRELIGLLPTIFRSASIGTILGAIPGIGSITAAFLGYDQAKRVSKHPELFGKGSLEGVAAPESANNAVCGANLIPVVTLGIPGSLTAAVLMGAFMVHGLMPGPMLMQEHPSTLYALFILMLIANGLMFLIARPLLRVALRVITINKAILFPPILIFCGIGAYGTDLNFFDMKVMFFFALIGFGMKKLNLSPAIFLISFILGPLAENAIRQSLLISQGSIAIFFTRPIALGLFLLSVASIVWALWRRKTPLVGESGEV